MKKLKIECSTKLNLPIEKIYPFQGNLKKLDDEERKQLRKQIEDTGFAFAINVWKNKNKYYILDGHQRLSVLKDMSSDGFDCSKIPCVEVNAKTFKDAKRRVLQGTSQYGKMTNESLEEYLKDSDLDLSELENFRFPEIDLSKIIKDLEGGKTDDDAIPEEVEAITKTGDLWLLGEHRLLCGDCTLKSETKAVVKSPPKMFFTSPPYSDQRDYKGGLDLSVSKLSGCMDVESSMYVINLGYQRKDGEVFEYWNEWML